MNNFIQVPSQEVQIGLHLLYVMFMEVMFKVAQDRIIFVLHQLWLYADLASMNQPNLVLCNMYNL